MAYQKEKIKAYVFDLDGTLLNSMCVWEEVLLGYLNEKKVAYPPTIMRDISALGLYKTCAYLQEHYLPQDTADGLFAMFTQRMKEQYDHFIPLKPNAENLLLALKQRGVLLCALTAGVHYLFDGCLQRLGVAKYFDYIWSTEDFGLKKTDPTIYLQVAEKLGVAPRECVMVDDNLNALKTAKSVGFQTIGVFDEVERAAESAMTETADLYIRDFSKLI